MSWTEFWAPNLVQWVVGAAITAIVSAAVGLTARYFLRRWFDRWFRPWLEQQLGEQIRISRRGADASELASQHALTASADARATGDNVRQANATLEFVGETLGDNVGETRRMAKRLDDFLTANLQLRTLLTQHGIPIPDTARVNGVVTGEVEAQTITGRHRLRTQMVTIPDERDTE